MNHAPAQLPTVSRSVHPSDRDALRLQYCDSCQQHVLYPQARCPSCHTNALRHVPASGKGTLYAYVVQPSAQHFSHELRPRVIAVMALEEGPHMLSDLVDVPAVPEQLKLDMPLEVVHAASKVQGLPVVRPVQHLGPTR